MIRRPPRSTLFPYTRSSDLFVERDHLVAHPPGQHPSDLLVLAGFHQFVYQVRCRDRKSTRLNSSHSQISYAVFCLKKKKQSGNTDGGRAIALCSTET